MLMKNPPHPGRIVRQECIEALGLTVTAAAKGLGVTRKTLSELVNGNSGISPEMAIRLSKAFGSSPEVWLGLQLDYDLDLMRRVGNKIRVAKAFTSRLTGSDWGLTPWRSSPASEVSAPGRTPRRWR